MTQKTKTRVQLDTRQAKAQLRGFVRESARTAGRVSNRVRQAVGRGLGVVSLGAGVGTGLAAVRGATQSGFGDVVSEALGVLGAELAQFVFGDLDEKAKAAKSAREATIQAFGAIAGHADDIPEGAHGYFQQIKKLREAEERGREMFERDDRFYGTGVDDILKRIINGIGQFIEDGFNSLIESLPLIGGGEGK